MSASVTRDMMTLISELGYGEIGKGIYDPQLLSIRTPPHGILVEQRNTAPMPDVLNAQEYVAIMNETRLNDGLPIYDWANEIPNWADVESGKFTG